MSKLCRTAMPSCWLIAGVLLLALSGCSSDDTDSRHTLRPVTIAVSRTPLSAPIYVAKHMGYFQDAGLKVTLKEVIGGQRSFDAVMHGDADLGTSSETVMMFAALQQKDVVILSSFVQSDNDLKLVVHPQLKAPDSRKLEGKRIGYIKGTASEYFLSALLELDGADKDRIQLVTLNPEQMPEALATRAVDALSVWEPYAYLARQRLLGKVNIMPTRNLYTLSFNLIANRGYAEGQQKTITQVLEALDKAISFIHTQPEFTKNVLKKNLQLEDDFIEWIWADYLFKLSISQALLQTMQNQARWAQIQQLTTETGFVDFRQYIDTRPLFKLLPEAVAF